MKRLANIFRAALAAGIIGIANVLHEGGKRFSTGRSYIHTPPPQDARFDVTQEVRTEILRKSRYFEANNAVMNRLCDLFEQFTVGANGLQIIAASSDEEWNTAAAEVWAEWCQFCDLTSLQNFGTIQSLIARAWFNDGEIFILKTYGEDTNARAGQPRRRPRIQLIESHRICTPPQMYSSEGRNITDGIELDPRGRPIAYWVREQNFSDLFAATFGLPGFSNPYEETFRRVPADQMVHVFEPQRAGQYRGLPFVSSVINDLHDLDDLQLLEMQAAKEEASVTWALENEAGEIPAHLKGSREKWSQTTQTPSGTTSTEDRTSWLHRILGGGRKIALKLGEKLHRLTGERPSIVTQGYWDFLMSKICAGVGISKLLVFPWSMQGTVTRADLDVANAFFRARSAVLAQAFMSIRQWVMDWHRYNDIRVADAPADWRKVRVRAPRSVNVDVGRNSAALVSEYKAGWRTLDAICGELGEDWRDVLKQRAAERVYARNLEIENNLKPGELIEAALDAIKAQPAPPAASPQQEPVAA